MVAGSGAVGESTDEGHDVYAEKLGDRWKKPLEGGKPVIVRADQSPPQTLAEKVGRAVLDDTDEDRMSLKEFLGSGSFVPGETRLANDSGNRGVNARGLVHRGLLVHKVEATTFARGNSRRVAAYAVTHMQSGLRILTFKTQTDAKLCALRLGALGTGEKDVETILRTEEGKTIGAIVYAIQDAGSPLAAPALGPSVPSGKKESQDDPSSAGLSPAAAKLLKRWRFTRELSMSGYDRATYEEAALALVTGRVPPIEGSIKAKILLTDIGGQLAQQPVVPKPNKVAIAKTPEEKLAVTEMSAGKNDVRYYLNGTLLDKKNRRIAATDGKRAFMLNDAPVDELMQQYADPPAGDAILRYRAARVKEQKALDSFRGPNGEPPKAKPWVNGKYPDLDRVVPRDMPKNSVVVDANTLAATLNGMLQSGKYLGLPKVYGIDLETPGDSCGVMPRYLLDAANQFRALGYDRFSLGFGELPTQLIVARSLDGKASAVIMPIAGDSVFQPIRLADHSK